MQKMEQVVFLDLKAQFSDIEKEVLSGVQNCAKRRVCARERG